ncbi:MAG: hydrogenase maturation nickel metallochaperone HypA [Deltaproteobacteria bacterium]|nr:MAG: hydrogenase maturation nickel metallochaperone HypA [Deltaproteobacteria bacterium]
MHEMGIALEIIKIATASIPEDAHDARVRRINLMVGKLSAVVPDSLRFCFDIAAKDTPLAGADLVIEEVPVQIRCQACHAVWTVMQPVFQCQKCGSSTVTIISGRELDIRSIEIEETNA